MVLFWGVGGIGDEKGRRHERPMEFELCFTTCRAFKQSKFYVFMFCIICFGGDQNLARVEWVTRH